MATCGYNSRGETGVRQLRDNLSRYIRLAESGERVVVTAHGRILAELVAPGSRSGSGSVHCGHGGDFARLIAAGTVTPPAEDGDPLEGCPAIRLAPGTASTLIDSDREET